VYEECLRFSSAKIVEFVSFTGAFTSQYVVKPVKETCQKVTRFDEPYKTACFWGVNETSKDGHVYDLGLCEFVEYFHVFPTIYLRRRKGPAVPERDLQNMDREKIDWQHILSNHDDARDQLFRIFPSGKTGIRRREHRVYWFPSSFYWFPIYDGRNCELLNSSSEVKNVFVRTKPSKTKGCKFGGAWRMSDCTVA